MTSGYKPVIDIYVAHHAYHDGPYSHRRIKVLFGKGFIFSKKQLRLQSYGGVAFVMKLKYFKKMFGKITSLVAPIS